MMSLWNKFLVFTYLYFFSLFTSIAWKLHLRKHFYCNFKTFCCSAITMKGNTINLTVLFLSFLFYRTFCQDLNKDSPRNRSFLIDKERNCFLKDGEACFQYVSGKIYNYCKNVVVCSLWSLSNTYMELDS